MKRKILALLKRRLETYLRLANDAEERHGFLDLAETWRSHARCIKLAIRDIEDNA